MKKTPFYYDKCSRKDADTLVGIQAENLYSTVGSNEQELGSLSYLVCERTLLASIRIDLVRIAVRRRSDTITGFIIGMSPAIADRVLHLKPVIQVVLPQFHYPCFMQVCVEVRNRRKYIGKKLLEQMEYEARRQNFGAIVSEVRVGNNVGRSFLKSSGFKTLLAPALIESTIFYKKLTNVTK